MKNNYRLLVDFYLDLLSIPHNDLFRLNNQSLYAAVRDALAKEISETAENTQRVCEQLAKKDRCNG